MDFVPLLTNLEIVANAELKNLARASNNVSSLSTNKSTKNRYDNPFFNSQYFAVEASMRAGHFADIGIKKIVHVTLGEYTEEGYKWEYKGHKSKTTKFQNHFFEASIAAIYGISFKYDLKKNRIDSFSLTEYGLGLEFCRKSIYGWQIFIGGSSGASAGFVLGGSFSGKAGWIID